ncbi:hypothetical protein MOB18_21790, partial [Bacillus inaquosorum]|uniref:hypothetical protein n=1 Tax=Bacillus inaquosorum TaxID=483913 RepID=UPI0022831CAF
TASAGQVWGRLAEQKQKRRLKKDLIMPAAAGIRFAEMRPGLYGSLSASFGLRGCFSSLLAGSMPAIKSRKTLVFRPCVTGKSRLRF